MSLYVKDPDAVLDYTIDWSDWLGENETISTRTVIADTGITVDSSSIVDGTSVMIWLSKGTVGQYYRVTCRIVTTAARTDDRSITIQVEER
jgi:hypothetical protein